MGVFFHKMDGSKAGPSSRSDRNIFESLLREDLSDSDDDFEIPHVDLSSDSSSSSSESDNEDNDIRSRDPVGGRGLGIDE